MSIRRARRLIVEDWIGVGVFLCAFDFDAGVEGLIGGRVWLTGLMSEMTSIS